MADHPPVVDGEPRVLVADDDPEMRTLLERVLTRAGMRPTVVGDGRQALEHIAAEAPDVLLLDLDMPEVDGYTVLEELDRVEFAVVVVTGHDSEGDRILGLELGADDYVVKPFSPRELVARIRAVLRRTERARATGLVGVGGGLEIDTIGHQARLDGVRLDLTRREFELLAFLAMHPGEACNRARLLEEVWGSSDEWQDPATVTEHVRRLRTKLGPEVGAMIETERGLGYRFRARP